MKLESYGLIGDLHSAALAGKNGSIDWLCLPRFESDACFSALLGTEDNGCWRISPARKRVRGKVSSVQRYRPDTLILETEFRCPTGMARVTDFMLPGDDSRQLVRIVEGLHGRVPMEMYLTLRVDYGRILPWVRHAKKGIIAIGGPDAFRLTCDVPTRGEAFATVADFNLRAGETKTFVLSWHWSHLKEPRVVRPRSALARTERFWKQWTKRCTYTGKWRDQVVRSLITLKALTYAPTGGIVAAPTTSLPEKLGGVRNWDYRYCWLRDATFTLYAFMETGYTEEAKAWIDWLLRAAAGDPDRLQIVYGVRGEARLTEFELHHLRGYENSRPVRVGNLASRQFQLDVYGEIMDAMHLAREVGISPGGDSWSLQQHMLAYLEKHWREPDEGIWEIRGPRRHFTHSKVMCWVAVDRAIKAIERFGLKGPLPRWRRLRQRIHRDVCRHGFDRRRKIFTQYYGSNRLDASLLMMPLVGFLPPTDPRIVRTVEAIQRNLCADGLVHRYDPGRTKSLDGLPPGEGVFLPCSFWMADCLHLMGRTGEAESLFGRLVKLGNGLGLMAEQYDPARRRMVGNFPQALTHVAMVNTANNLAHDTGSADRRK